MLGSGPTAQTALWSLQQPFFLMLLLHSHREGFQVTTPYLPLSLSSRLQILGGRSWLALWMLQVHLLRQHHRDPGSESVGPHSSLCVVTQTFYLEDTPLFFRTRQVRQLREWAPRSDRKDLNSDSATSKVCTLGLVTLLPWVFSTYMKLTEYLTQRAVTVVLKD